MSSSPGASITVANFFPKSIDIHLLTRLWYMQPTVRIPNRKTISRLMSFNKGCNCRLCFLQQQIVLICISIFKLVLKFMHYILNFLLHSLQFLLDLLALLGLKSCLTPFKVICRIYYLQFRKEKWSKQKVMKQKRVQTVR